MRVESAGEFRDLKSCLLEARCVHKLTADALLNEFTTSVARDRDATVELLIRLGAIDARQLYLAQACPSMYAYCTQVMRMSENSAFQRIRAARAARRFPQVLPMLADGRLHVTAVALLARHLTRDNAEELVADATHRGRVDIERMLAARFPKSDVATVVRPMPAANSGAEKIAQVIANMAQSPCLGKVVPKHSGESAAATGPLGEGEETRAMREVMSHVVHTAARAAGATEAGSEPVLEAIAAAVTDTFVRAAWPHASSGTPAPEPRARVTPRAAGRYAWQLTADQPLQDMLEEARELIGPAGARELQDVLKRALTLLVESLRKSRCAATEHPAAQRAAAAGRYIPRAVVRAAWARDGGQCTFTAPDGRRCCERSGLELDHVIPFARGGKSTPDNLRLLCRAHNLHEAERAYGADHVQAQREASRARAQQANALDAERRTRAEARDTRARPAGAGEPPRPRTWAPEVREGGESIYFLRRSGRISTFQAMRAK